MKVIARRRIQIKEKVKKKKKGIKENSMGTNKTRWRGKERKDRRQQKTPHSGYRFAWRVSWCGKWRCGRGNMRASVMYHCEWAIWRETRRTWRPWGIYVCIYKPVHIDYKKQRELDSEKRKKKKRLRWRSEEKRSWTFT